MATRSTGADSAGASLGATGDATTLAVTTQGSAVANAASGSAGITGTADSRASASSPLMPGSHTSPVASYQATLLPVTAQALLNQLLSDNGPAASALDTFPCGVALCTTAGVAVSVQLATYTPTGSGCGSAPSLAGLGPTCAVALAVAFGSIASAVVEQNPEAGAASPSCAIGMAGRPTAVAIAVHGAATAIARGGITSGTVCGASGSKPAALPVTAASGGTGSALGIGIAQQGSAGATATSGNSGAALALTDGPVNGGPADSVVSTTGATGPAVAISIGRLGASAQVRSGNSGRAAAICTHCPLERGGDTVAHAQTGQTGSSFSQAVAGLQSYSNAVSGDSGDAAAWAVHGTGSTFLTGQPSENSRGNVARTTNPGRVYVGGRSGDTGNVVATATDLLTWVSVLTQTGLSGPVASIATWNVDGCMLIFATFSLQCSPAAVQHPFLGSGPQIRRNPVVSPSERNSIFGERSPSQLGFARVSGASAGSTVGRTSANGVRGAASEPRAGHGSNGQGGARNQLVGDHVGPLASNPGLRSLTSWWAMLTLCVIVCLSVALIFAACRYKTPRRMNSS
ncbi:MAG: hypothetical protein M3O28_08070 [Actinomycetota bacterium]|nr:hypothetical protein [Actinomycetota bacterium]